MKLNDIKKRVEKLIALGIKTLKELNDEDAADNEYATLMREFHAGSISFLGRVFGKDHIFYQTFIDSTNLGAFEMSVRHGIGILKAAKSEIDEGWLFELKGLVSAEIFNDFFEMSAHLLEENFKDPAAVMIGSTLEEHLRQLCTKNGIPLSTPHPNKAGVDVVKKADVMNADLAKAKVYNLLDQKQITAWLGLRNSAAHGKYSDYTKEQVEAMQHGVMNLITRVV